MLSLLTPSTTINYNFVAGVYGTFALLTVALFVAQRFTSAVDGFYIVLAPFVPCFFWALVVRQRWLAAGGNAAATEDSETKKDK